jgi:hypothetical protein
LLHDGGIAADGDHGQIGQSANRKGIPEILRRDPGKIGQIAGKSEAEELERTMR